MQRFLRFFRALSVVCVGLLVPIAQASDFQSPRTMALGGAGHAGPLLNDPIYLNPSFMSFNQTYGIGFSYLKYSESAFRGRNFNVSLQDGKTELFQAGVGYTAREEGGLVTVAGSRRIDARMAVGAGGKMFLGKDHRSAKDGFVAFAGVPLDWLQLSFMADNLSENADGKSRGFYREFVLGSKANLMNIVLVYVDPHLAPTAPGKNSFGHEIGLEFTMMKDLFLRVGQFRNSNVGYQNGRRGGGIGMGLGWVAPRISLDYGYSRINDTRGGLQKTSVHNFGATAFF